MGGRATREGYSKPNREKTGPKYPLDDWDTYRKAMKPSAPEGQVINGYPGKEQD